jgi:predicted nucleic acid-binding protein
MKIVSNSSPLIALAKIGRLKLLEHEIIVPKAVFEEMTRSRREYARKLYEWGENRVSVVKNRQAVEYLELVLDRGEAEVIVLADEESTSPMVSAAISSLIFKNASIRVA